MGTATGEVVDLAVAPNGDVYFSQLFAGEISRIAAGTGTVETFRSVSQPGGLEIRDGFLYAAIDVLSGPSEEDPDAPPAAKLVRFRL